VYVCACVRVCVCVCACVCVPNDKLQAVPPGGKNCTHEKTRRPGFLAEREDFLLSN